VASADCVVYPSCGSRKSGAVPISTVTFPPSFVAVEPLAVFAGVALLELSELEPQAATAAESATVATP
jgi:hypothetical protein